MTYFYNCDIFSHKFENYIVSDKPNEIPNGSEIIPDLDDQYGTVVVTYLNNHCLMYGAEIDCCISDEHISLNNYCEIKTCKGKF